jgi:hypothetical protein
MRPLWIGAVLVVACAALIGAASVPAWYSRNAAVVLEMDRDRPSFVSGIFAGERAGDVTFAWSGERAVVRLSGLDRSTPWSCVVRLRGARADAVALPDVTLLLDGALAAKSLATNDFAEITAQAPRSDTASGLTLTMLVAPTFRPGGGDPRELGVQVDRLACQPDRGWAWPPTASVVRAGLASAAIAAAALVAGVSTGAALVSAAIAALAQAALLATGGAVFGAFPGTMTTLSLGVAIGIALIGRAIAMAGRPTAWASLALVAAAGGGYLRLLALLHPAKTVVDALFQAHRLEWVLAGRYFFTQPMPDGVTFPYAIGLYVVAAPWAHLVPDHVTLLRGVVAATDALGAGLLYVAMSSAWRSRAAGLLAVVFFMLVPLPYVVVGNGNLTNAFGQGVALVALTMVASGALSGTSWAGLLTVTLVTTLALLSHVSTLTLLGPTLLAAAVIDRVLGGRAFRAEAWRLAAVTTVAALLALGLYYRHFTDAYRDALLRVRASPSAPATAGPVPATSFAAEAAPAGSAMLTRPLSWRERAWDVAGQTGTDIGWPLLALAALGAWQAIRSRQSDRLSLLLVAWGGTWLAFVLAGTLTRVDTQYQRYASEFMGRVNLAAYPVAVILAARGAAWPWTSERRSRVLQGATVLLTLAACLVGVRSWIGWVL